MLGTVSRWSSQNSNFQVGISRRIRARIEQTRFFWVPRHLVLYKQTLSGYSRQGLGRVHGGVLKISSKKQGKSRFRVEFEPGVGSFDFWGTHRQLNFTFQQVSRVLRAFPDRPAVDFDFSPPQLRFRSKVQTVARSVKGQAQITRATSPAMPHI